MKKIFRFCIIAIILTSFLYACGQKKDNRKKEVEEAVDKIDSLKGQFDPSVTINPSSSHWALNVSFNGLRFEVDTTAVFIRRGKLPYLNETRPSLPFVIKYEDATGKLLGQYSIETPTAVKSCEPGTEGIKPGVITSFEILVPALEGIRTVVVDSAGKEWRKVALPRRKVPGGSPNTPADSTVLR
ncbi:MAG: hypothetical protein KIT80_14665 [Chitinophagaceae bacterium]|nr:hypothetical protein [Chitinophagaceae bacterium]MCW5928157.1 hypothetical protein [Chitinophagaceae bacterium]